MKLGYLHRNVAREGLEDLGVLALAVLADWVFEAGACALLQFAGSDC